MKTFENIDGKIIAIDWEFRTIIEKHDSNWAEWELYGEDKDGRIYSATCQADIDDPKHTHNKVENII